MGRSKKERNPLLRYFATTSLGLEYVLERELRKLGASYIRRASSGVSFSGDRRLMMRACMELRTAHRILWEVGVFKARDVDMLYRKVRDGVKWSHLIPPDRTFAIFANTSGEPFHDSRFVGLRIKDAIVDRLRDDTGERPSVDPEDPDIRLVARVRGGICQLSMDASGRSLHHRFYREQTGKAPLRESLAAGLVILSEWNGKVPLLDPMCGSGTIPIEAGLIAKRRAPVMHHQRFGFQRWVGYRAKLFESELERLRADERAETYPVYGSDYSSTVVASAESNAVLAGVSEGLSFAVERIEQLENPCPDRGPGLLLTNPPYGERINERIELQTTFRKLGDRLKAHFPGWECWILLPDDELIASFGLRAGKKIPLKNGPLDVFATQLFVD